MFMLTRITHRLFAPLVVGILFLPPVATARSVKECSAKHGPGSQCRPKAASVFSRLPPRLTLGIGDVVSVTIFEAEPGGLFIPADASARPGNFVTLPDQTIDSNGNITVPYVGTIRGAGRTPSEVQQAIVKALTTP